jgi:hypothetical protein
MAHSIALSLLILGTLAGLLLKSDPALDRARTRAELLRMMGH